MNNYVMPLFTPETVPLPRSVSKTPSNQSHEKSKILREELADCSRIFNDC